MIFKRTTFCGSFVLKRFCMRKLFFIVPQILLTLSIVAQPPKGPAEKGMTFGIKTNPEGAVDANQLPSLLAKKSTAEVKVKGKVADDFYERFEDLQSSTNASHCCF